MLTAGLAPAITAEQASASAARANAEKSYRAGRYDEVASFAQAFPKDEPIAVWNALSIAARGDYARAESVLQTFATAKPGGEASLELGLLQMYVGKRPEARRSLTSVLAADVPNPGARDYLRAARASRALNRIDDANSYFKDAIGVAPTDAQLNSEWGDLFYEAHQNGEAAKSYQESLKAVPEYVPALVGMARALMDENPPQAVAFVNRVLKQNPNDAGANSVLAHIAIYQDKKEEAHAAIDAILKVNPKNLEALSLKAAMAYVEGRDAEYQQAVADALRVNPMYGEVHRVVGEVTARYYRFDEAVEHTRKAIALDRENVHAIADLGNELMRTGDETNARRNLETAFRIDKWDAQTFNLLTLLDHLDTFQTITEGDMVIRLDADETPVMKNYVPALARESLAALSKTWEFTPKGPILVEMFPRHDDFAVRTLGLPGMIGALGACFGRVVTLDSPTARGPGEFNWGETLWHELAHVITLQLSGNRLPRWLSEGASVFEERRGRPDWGREMDIPFARAIGTNKVARLSDLNSGFASSATINYAYYQASLVVELIFDTYGQRKLRGFIAAYADGSDTEQALRKSLGIGIDDLQKQFDAMLDTRYGKLRAALKVPEGLEPDMPLDKVKAIASAHPESFAAQMALGDALAAANNPDAAIAAFEKANELVPNVRGEESPLAAIAAVALKKGDKARAARALEALIAFDHTAVVQARQLVTLLDPKDAARMQVALKRVVSVDPFDGPAHSALGRVALNNNETANAIQLFRVALAAKPLDKAGAHADLAEALLKAGQKDEARREVLAALLIAPTYTRAQDLLLKLQEGSH